MKNLYSQQGLVVTTIARFKYGWLHIERIFLVILMSAALIYKPAQKSRHQARAFETHSRGTRNWAECC